MFRGLAAVSRFMYSRAKTIRPEKMAQAMVAPALTPATVSRFGSRSGPVSARNPACHRQRLPPPARTRAVNGEGAGMFCHPG